MADALVNTVIDSLKSFAEDQLATFLGVDKHTQKLTRHVTAIHAVLQDAEEMGMTSHGHDHALKDWLQKLTDAALVLDDILDQCAIQSNRHNSHPACFTPFHPNKVLFRWDVGKRMKYITQRFHDIDKTKGASILVTTRLENVANIVRTTVSIHHLSPLSEDDNWSLFQHHAFGPDKEDRSELVPIGKEIVKKCAGLPLAAKALGSLLRFKSHTSQWLSVKGENTPG